MARAAKNSSGVPIHQLAFINNATTFVREDLGDLTELKKHMTVYGQLVPILTFPDFRIIDGARRLQAAIELGWDDIDVIATDNWYTIKDVFLKTHTAIATGAPAERMRWLEYSEVRRNLLGKIYLSQVVKPAQAASKRAGSGIVSDAYGGDRNFGELFGLEPKSTRAMNTLAAALDRIKRERPDEYRQARSEALAVEAAGGGVWTAMGMLRKIQCPSVDVDREENAKAAKEQYKALSRAVLLLDNICQEAGKVAPLNIALSADQARELQVALRKATSRLYPLRRSLRELSNYQEREEEDGDED